MRPRRQPKEAAMPTRELALANLALYQQALHTAERIKTLRREIDDISREVHERLDDLDRLISYCARLERAVARQPNSPRCSRGCDRNYPPFGSHVPSRGPRDGSGSTACDGRNLTASSRFPASMFDDGKLTRSAEPG
jgi:hypothetical protein